MIEPLDFKIPEPLTLGLPTFLGQTGEDGLKAFAQPFTYKCLCGNEFQFQIIHEDDASPAQIEDMLLAGFEGAMEREFVRHQEQAGKLASDTASWPKHLKLDVAKELKRIRNWMKQVRASSHGKTLFHGVTLINERTGTPHTG
jgi:hypothetical protein